MMHLFLQGIVVDGSKSLLAQELLADKIQPLSVLKKQRVILSDCRPSAPLIIRMMPIDFSARKG